MDVIFKRRSIRRFADRAVEEEKIDKLLRAAMQAPSAKNQQPWEFIVVRDKNILNKLAELSPYSKMAAEAPLVIVVLGNEDKMYSTHHAAGFGRSNTKYPAGSRISGPGSRLGGGSPCGGKNGLYQKSIRFK